MTGQGSVWGPGPDEETRSYLQQRLEVLSGLMFWAFVVLLGFTFLMYFGYPEIEPEDEWIINWFSLGGVISLAVIWRGFLVRRTLTMAQLHRIDAIYAITTGLAFGASAWFAKELRPSAYGCLLYASFMVLLRAIVVPSTGTRTLVTGILTFLPMACVAIAVSGHQELPAWAFVIADLVICTIIITLATIGSQIIYGLRKQVSVAMQLGQYTLERKIGEGGMGEVYRAHHALLRRPTAIKLLIPSRIGGATVERFEREVQHMSKLTHPNTVAVFDYGRNPEGIFYYAMEYLDGIDLERLVAEYGPQPVDRVIAIDLLVGGEREALGREPALDDVAREILDRGGLRTGQPGGAQRLVGGREDLGRARELAPRIEREHARPDRACGGGRELLADDRACERLDRIRGGLDGGRTVGVDQRREAIDRPEMIERGAPVGHAARCHACDALACTPLRKRIASSTRLAPPTSREEMAAQSATLGEPERRCRQTQDR